MSAEVLQVLVDRFDPSALGVAYGQGYVIARPGFGCRWRGTARGTR